MNAKTIIHVGIALILLGVVAFIHRVSGDTSREKAVDVAIVQGSVQINPTFSISPLVGGIALVGGIVLVAVGMKKST